ncbi:MAG: transposase [Acidobacteria bacterium]|nr:transposase [Acidobacteriota bacterium]
MRAMALGKRKREQQETLWIPTGQIAKPPAHPFYKRLNTILVEHQFDDFVEKICSKFYAPKMGRPGLAPGIYFRLLLIGYFEGLDSERGIALNIIRAEGAAHAAHVILSCSLLPKVEERRPRRIPRPGSIAGNPHVRVV